MRVLVVLIFCIILTFYKRFIFFLLYKSRCLKRFVVFFWVFRFRVMIDRFEVTIDMFIVLSNFLFSIFELGLIFNFIML